MEKVRKFKVLYNNMSANDNGNVYSLIRETKDYLFLQKDSVKTKHVMKLHKRTHNSRVNIKDYWTDVVKVNVFWEL